MATEQCGTCKGYGSDEWLNRCEDCRGEGTVEAEEPAEVSDYSIHEEEDEALEALADAIEWDEQLLRARGRLALQARMRDAVEAGRLA